MNDDPLRDRAIADLLPFYATGRLDAGDEARVSAALDIDPALRHELAVVHEERQTTIAANERLGSPSRQARERFFALLEAQPRRRARRLDAAGWIAARIDALRPRPLAWSLAALVVVVILEAAVIGMAVGPTSRFETASVPRTPPAGAIVIVAFAPDATAAEISALLKDQGATIVDGPLAGGLYQLRVGAARQPPAATAKVVAALLARPAIVRFAAPGGDAR